MSKLKMSSKLKTENQLLTEHRLRCANACIALYNTMSLSELESTSYETKMCYAAGGRLLATLYPEINYETQKQNRDAAKVKTPTGNDKATTKASKKIDRS